MWTKIFQEYVSDHTALIVHVYLLSGDILATWAVAAGIIWEGAFDLREIVHRLVIWGVAAETLCSLALFTFDEGISAAQQDKIISLDKYIVGRQLTKEQFDAIQSLRGQVPGILLMPEDHCSECFNFADQLAVAFRAAGLQTMLHFAEIHGSGAICVYQTAPYSDLIESTLTGGGIPAHLCPVLPPGLSITAIPAGLGLISVPEAPPFPSMDRPYLGPPGTAGATNP
jgi:hypothetical protein